MLMNTQIFPQIDLAYTDYKGHPGISMDVLGSTHPCGFSKQVWYFISKNQPGLRRSYPLRQAILYWLATHHEYLAACFWRFRSRSALRRRVYVASASQYPSRSRNCGRLLIAATQSSRLNCRSRLVRSHGNNVRNVIIAHVISADAQLHSW